MYMKTTLTLLTSAVLLQCCCSSNNDVRNKAQTKNKISQKQVENFETFFKRFSEDSTFQVSRVEFPIRRKEYNIDLGEFERADISRQDWGFFDIATLAREKEYIITINRTGKNRVFALQKEDTGLYVEYIFEISNGVWQMVEIIDSST